MVPLIDVDHLTTVQQSSAALPGVPLLFCVGSLVWILLVQRGCESRRDVVEECRCFVYRSSLEGGGCWFRAYDVQCGGAALSSQSPMLY